MPEIDELINTAAGRWRDTVDERYATADLALNRPPNRTRSRAIWSASLGGAAVVVVAMIIAYVATDRGGKRATTAGKPASEASCAAPFLRADQRVTPPEPGHPTTLGTVRAGQTVTVYGHWFYAGPCHDTGSTTTAPPAPVGSVRLLLTTSTHDTVTVHIVHPGADGAFVAVIKISAHTPTGPATITDDRGDRIDLVVTRGK